MVDALAVEVGPVCRAEILNVIVPVLKLYHKVTARGLRRGVDKVAVFTAAEYPLGLAALRLVHRDIHRRVAEVVYKIKKPLELISCHKRTSNTQMSISITRRLSKSKRTYCLLEKNDVLRYY